MAFIHSNSCECATSQLDLFTAPLTETATDVSSCIDYYPVSTITDNTPIEISILNSGSDYVDINSTELHITAQILKSDGQPIGDDAQVAPANLLLHSLFSQVDVKLNDTIISSTNNNYAYRAYLETLLSFGSASKQSQLAAALYYYDTPGHLEEKNPHAEAARNVGMKARYAHFNNGGIVDMVGKIHSDIFFQDKYLPNGVDVRVRLIRNKDSFCLMSQEDNATFKIKLLDCKIQARKVKVSSNVALSHAEALLAGDMLYPIRRNVCKSFTIPRGNFNFTHENIFQGPMPTRIIMGFVNNAAYNGSFKHYPYNFKTYDMKSLKLYIDGQDQIIRPIITDYGNNQYINAYLSLFRGTGKIFTNEDLDIKRLDYPRGYAIYAFDLTTDLNPDDAHFSLIKTGSMRCEVTFGTALPETVNLVCMGEFENIIRINKDRQVSIDYV